MGRQVLLDNSIFQLGESFSNDKFAQWVQKLKPTYYIIPDVLDNCQQTIMNIHNWNKDYKKDLPGKTIGVIQGKYRSDLITCYNEIYNYVDKIAISFNSQPFMDKNIHKISQNRFQFIVDLLNQKKHSKPIHLLGTCTPQQMIMYSGTWDNIQSVDTSNPIVHGMFNVRYNERFGLDQKIQTKLVDIYNNHITQQMLVDIYYNIKMFRAIMER